MYLKGKPGTSSRSGTFIHNRERRSTICDAYLSVIQLRDTALIG